MTVRIAVVGAGGIARSHVSALAGTEGATVASVYDVDRERAADLAGRCGAAVARTVDEAVAACDAVYVCTWTAAHREVVEQAAKAGRAVFCEKPLAPSLAEAQAMAAAVAAAGVTSQVGLPLRWRPEFAVLRRWLADADGGAVLTAALLSDMPGRRRTLAGWRGDRSVAGGGMLLEVGFHDLDLLGWLLGPVAGVRAFATVADRGQGVEDGAVVNLAFDRGGVGSLVAVWHDAPHCRQTRRLQVICEDARYEVAVEPPTRRLVASGPGERRLVVDGADLDRMAAEMRLPTRPDEAFVDAVRTGAPAAPTIADAVATHELIDQAYRSAAA